MAEIIISIVSFAFGAVASYFTSAYFYNKSLSDLKQSQKESLCDFDSFLSKLNKNKWHKKIIDRSDVWICETDARYQIHLASDRIRDFQEDWTSRFINKKAFYIPVLLKIDSSIIEELHFVYCDEMRYLVPCPKIDLDEKRKFRSFYWDEGSLEFVVYRVIGSYRCLSEITDLSKVEVRKTANTI